MAKRRPSMLVLERRLNELEAVIRAHEMKGSYPLSARQEIEEDYEDTKAEFLDILRSLITLAES